MTVMQEDSTLASLNLFRQQVADLDDAVRGDAARRLERWRPWITRASYLPSAGNLAAYLALRCHDIRDVQSELITWGASSLGRCEAYVLPNLEAVQGTLAALAGEARLPDRGAFALLDARLGVHTRDLFGEGPTPGIMVTFPSEAADDPVLIRDLLEAGMTVARINLAHDDEAAWGRMLLHLNAACEATGKSCRVLMDLAGPKVRTGQPRWPKKQDRLSTGEQLILATDEASLPDDLPGVTCTLPEAVRQAQVGQSVWFDDGKIGTLIERAEGGVLTLRVTHAPPKGAKLKAEKGINFPDTTLNLPALTDKDRQDVHFAVKHANMLGYSFVQTLGDVQALLDELEALDAPAGLGIVLKIETKLAVQNLADLMVKVAGTRPCGVMIARGDLAVELGFARLTEIQEEMLWLAEAAHLPVVWATQVLEGLVKKGEAKRGEFTDAANGVRAEVIMLNKGPFVVEGVREVSGIIGRMRQHFNKKRPQFRALNIAQPGTD
ncbi:pyruvate kinase [Deinococcus fonticola]|uniref:pyruvate kinase n=1 Tax=Deinococcus fonticola TaxID=2528713 RepID=UPI0010750593|nr:pyruvate kinase [Deinococcus fonticola]